MPTLNAIFANGDFALENGLGVIVDYADPVWTPALQVDDGNTWSLFPVLFLAGHQNQVLGLQLTLGPEYQGVSVHLLGYLNGEVVFQSDSSLGASGTWSTAAYATFDVSGLARRSGDFAWYVMPDAGAGSLFLATTRLELSWVYELPSFLSNLDYSAALRPLFAQIDTAGAPNEIVAAVVAMCYYGFYKRYDTVTGAPHFGCTGQGGTYLLGQYWYTGQSQAVNCYDQAGIVQIMLGCLGISCTWAFMQPYGYITTTNLIGWGPCNNPFFSANNTPRLIGVNAQDRTAFGNHAFAVISGYVLDACAGPHIGRETIPAYVADAIDTQTTLSNPQNTGTAANVNPQTGVTSLSFAPPAAEHPAPSPSVRSLLGPPERVAAALSHTTARVDWTALIGELSAQFGWKLAQSSITPAPDGVFAQWLLEDGAQLLGIRVFKARDRQVALAREIEYLEAFQNDPAACLERIPALGAAGLRSVDGLMLIFIERSVFVVVTGSSSRAGAAAARIHTALAHAPPGTRDIAEAQTSSLSLSVGERASFASDSETHHSLAGDAVRIAARRETELHLVGRKAGTSRLQSAHVDGATLDMDLRFVQITVVP